MSDITFPVVEGKTTHWPDKAVCPVCGENKVFEPHSFAILTAGALLMNRAEDYGGRSDDLDGFLTLGWHGAHEGGVGADRDIGCNLDIMQDTFGGQGELYFCSTECLRNFLNQSVDALENMIAKERL